MRRSVASSASSRPIAGKDPAHDRRLVVAQPVHVGQIGAEMLVGDPAARRRPTAADQQGSKPQQRADQPPPNSRRRRAGAARLAAWRRGR